MYFEVNYKKSRDTENIRIFYSVTKKIWKIANLSSNKQNERKLEILQTFD